VSQDDTPFDWIKIYDGVAIRSTTLHNNTPTGINTADSTLAEMNACNGNANFIGTSGDMTIEFRSIAIVNWQGYQISFPKSGGDLPAPYCGPLEFTSNVEPITLNVANITNVSPAALGGVAHEDFTAITCNIEYRSSYDTAFEGNTGVTFTNRFVVFVDWNQNDILDDAGEVYEIT
jgi:hypothetical protein